MAFGNPLAQFRNVLATKATLTPAAVAQGTSAEQTFTVPGAPDPSTTDAIVTIVKPSSQAGLVLGGVRVSAANQIGITYGNIPNSGGNITPTSETYLILIMW